MFADDVLICWERREQEEEREEEIRQITCVRMRQVDKMKVRGVKGVT